MLNKSCFTIGPYVAQFLAALIANLTMLSSGLIFGWSSPSLPKLLRSSAASGKDDSEFLITDNEGSWIVSLMSFGAIFGPIIISLLVDRIGRKWCLNIIVLPILISWLVTGLAKSVEMLYIGRFIGGLSVGASFALMPMYNGEIAEDRIRGAVCTLMTFFLNFGILIAYCVGPWVSHYILSIVSVIPSLLALLLFPWIPETPYFLLMKGSREKAIASLVWLRRRSDVNEELASLEVMVIEEQKNRDRFGIKKLFQSTSNRRAFAISIGLLNCQQFSGAIAIKSYSGLIFENSGFTGWTNYSIIILGVIGLIISMSTIFIIDLSGRRPILILSSLFASIFLLFEAIFFHVKSLGYDTSSFSWIPLVGIVGYYAAVSPGLVSIPATMSSELFPTDVKAPATMLLASYGSVLGVIISKIYQLVDTTFGTQWIFYAFSFITLIGLFFIYFYVPETKRVSLKTIQEHLKSGRSVRHFALNDQTNVTKS